MKASFLIAVTLLAARAPAEEYGVVVTVTGETPPPQEEEKKR